MICPQKCISLSFGCPLQPFKLIYPATNCCTFKCSVLKHFWWSPSKASCHLLLHSYVSPNPSVPLLLPSNMIKSIWECRKPKEFTSPPIYTCSSKCLTFYCILLYLYCIISLSFCIICAFTLTMFSLSAIFLCYSLISPCSLMSPSSDTERQAWGFLLLLTVWMNRVDPQGQSDTEREPG